MVRVSGFLALSTEHHQMVTLVVVPEIFTPVAGQLTLRRNDVERSI